MDMISAREIAGLILLWLLLTSAMAGPEPLTYQNSTIALQGKLYPVRIPQAYRFELLTDQLDGPRLMHFLDNGDLLIGSRSGNVYRLAPPYDSPRVLVRLTDYPHSIAYRDSTLFIAQTSGLYRVTYTPGQARIDARELRRLATLPVGGHNSRSVAIGPDAGIYLSLGISGNCSDEYLGEGYAFNDRRGGILVLDETQVPPQWKPYASGLRNPVGFDWHPETRLMYASNNGPDHQGFDLPPEYFSAITPASFHGMPWFQYDGHQVKRDDCIKQEPPRPIEDVRTPVVTFPARSAPMGVSFIPTEYPDPRLQSQALVALHGSWGTKPTGSYFGDRASRREPRVVLVRFEEGTARGVNDLISGFQLENGDRWARPVGVAVGPDDAIYITSDGGVEGLYRLKRME